MTGTRSDPTGGLGGSRRARAAFDMTMDAETPVYVISVAAELTGLHPQTLRTYDRLGLVTPGRSGGGGRRYSLRDIETLRHVAELTAAGIGLEGVKRILELEALAESLTARVAELEEALDDAQVMLERAAEQAAYLPELMPRPSQAVVVWQGRARRRR
ncbi:heat shock protein transcriptional repressor HspR [Actinopolymorpha pittospori]|uniref:MerR family transcriptional regulator/heat shock protein HspR n=1 Tax=Actinopolymorpha pittospori TaxID=648752 RepID=A0A927RJ72_9ACTN|nr:MerR family transcriptional regulator/heat shock protein HspR [Actinopolymorpha pittospori]